MTAPQGDGERLISERLAELRTEAHAFSGLQYVIDGSPRGWPWTSAVETNRVVDLVRALPGLLSEVERLTAERDEAKRSRTKAWEEATAAQEREAKAHQRRGASAALQARADRLAAACAEMRAALIERDHFTRAHPTQADYVTCRLCEETAAGTDEQAIQHESDCILAQPADERGSRILEVLAWYADEKNYECRPLDAETGGLPLTDLDGGQRAREALAWDGMRG